MTVEDVLFWQILQCHLQGKHLWKGNGVLKNVAVAVELEVSDLTGQAEKQGAI